MRSWSTAQQFDLHGKAHLADFIEKNSSAAGHFKQPRLFWLAPVNAPFTYPKSSLSSSVSGNAPQLMETNGSEARVEHECTARDKFFACAAFTINQHGAGGWRNGTDSSFQLFNDRTAADKILERVAAGGIALEGKVFALKNERFQRASHSEFQFLQQAGPFMDVIERSAFDSLHGGSVILITAVEDYEAAVQAVKGGAFDYIHKGPGLLEELKLAVGRALETLVLQRENFALQARCRQPQLARELYRQQPGH